MFTSAGGHVFRSGHPQHGVRGAAGHVNHHITHRDRDRLKVRAMKVTHYRTEMSGICTRPRSSAARTRNVEVVQSAPSSIDPQLTFSVRNGYGNI
ncbi:unnamed protein product [Leptidea sinapis]|uniref:Uncharacterized protein n=1 Tax=Leptidea sinapis TaxID=189913 RepID=A0A5E4PWW4_9NEOP|nr:unnamed protein product [Leptidea sinapis]